MSSSTLPDDLEIAPERTVGDWKCLNLDPNQSNAQDWDTAVAIFKARIQERFLDPVDSLIAAEKDEKRKKFGFATLAIDCLVIETLQAFREGEIDHKGKSQRLFVAFLTGWDAFKSCLPPGSDPEKMAEMIYKGYRCALHHSGATEGAFRVGVVGRMVEVVSSHEVNINRTCLHEMLKCEFQRYLNILRQSDQSERRCNFLKKMNAICGLGGP